MYGELNESNRESNHFLYGQHKTSYNANRRRIASHRVDRFDVYVLYFNVLPLNVDVLVLLLFRTKKVKDESSRVDHQ